MERRAIPRSLKASLDSFAATAGHRSVDQVLAARLPEPFKLIPLRGDIAPWWIGKD